MKLNRCQTIALTEHTTNPLPPLTFDALHIVYTPDMSSAEKYVLSSGHFIIYKKDLLSANVICISVTHIVGDIFACVESVTSYSVDASTTQNGQTDTKKDDYTYIYI